MIKVLLQFFIRKINAELIKSIDLPREHVKDIEAVVISLCTYLYYYSGCSCVYLVVWVVCNIKPYIKVHTKNTQNICHIAGLQKQALKSNYINFF